MLEEQDMSSLELTYDKVSWKNHKFKLLVAKLLALAKFKTGFSVDDCRLSIETMPQGSGCVIIFTLFPEIEMKKTDSEKSLVPSYLKERDPYIYRFDTLDNLLDMCKKLETVAEDSVRPDLIFSFKGKYFILIYPRPGYIDKATLAALDEYGTKMKQCKILGSHLIEFGKQIHRKKVIKK